MTNEEILARVNEIVFLVREHEQAIAKLEKDYRKITEASKAEANLINARRNFERGLNASKLGDDKTCPYCGNPKNSALCQSAHP
jgi:DNA repair exonuclease SbcCD ATPase subunit